MNLNWTEIKAGRVDCDGGDGGGGGGGLCFFFFPPLSDKSKHPHAERLAGAGEGGKRDPWVQWYPSRLCHFHNHHDSRTRTPISMTSEQDTTHTPTIMTKDATCIQMRVEVRARQILQGAAGAQRGDPAAVPAVPLQ